MTFKMAVRTVARRHGLHATFMPKPRSEFNGSGMHLKFSLVKDGQNILSVRRHRGKSVMRHFILQEVFLHTAEKWR